VILDSILALLSLIALEVILGIDNIIFISILSDRLPAHQQKKLRFWGMGLAMVMRLGLLALIQWIMHLSTTLFTVFNHEISGKDLVLVLGGVFLLYKSTKEIYHNTESKEEDPAKKKPAKFGRLLLEVLLLDMVFSVDSIITAVGMANELWVMYTAVIVTVLIMLAAAKPISNFILKHPSFKILALCFLMLIGVSLIAEGLDLHIPKQYIYFAMGFSFAVDIIQMRVMNKKKK